MDEWTLNDLLECSVCLDRLDTSSKVLPCQHTFCKKCLDEIVSSHKELRCPECRVLVDVKVEELPPNVLLMRILEGMRNNPRKRAGAAHHPMGGSSGPPSTPCLMPTPAPSLPPTSAHSGDTPSNLTPQHIRQKSNELLTNHQRQRSGDLQLHDSPRCSPPVNKTGPGGQPYARAIYDYASKEPGDLNFKKGDIVVLRRKIDNNWFYGELNGSTGAFPMTYVQIMTPLPSNHIPQCKALYDFRMNNNDEEGCLKFTKGEVITVIRRVDENWAEGRLADKIGIFPLAFVEMNNVARALMKLSTNSQPGPSRNAPPTPTSSEDATPLISTTSPPLPPQSIAIPMLPAPTPSTRQTSTSSKPSGPPSSVAPTSPSSSSSSSSSPTASSHTTSSSSSSTDSTPTSPPASAAPTPSKRHSFSHLMMQGGHSQPSTPHRYSAEILSSVKESSKSTASPVSSTSASGSHPPSSSSDISATGELKRQPSLRSGHKKSSAGGSVGGSATASSAATASPSSIAPPPPSSASPHISLKTPALYIAIYPYKPQKDDELELRRGSVYTVTERCQDGWYKGTSHRTQRSGVFPGNYVAPAKSLPALQAQLRGLRSGGGSSPSSRGQSAPATSSEQPRLSTPKNRPTKIGGVLATSTPPDLPPRSHSPNPTSTSWHAGHATTEPARSSVIPPPNVSVPSTPVHSTPSVEKKKDKSSGGGVSLMRRLTNYTRQSKSPPPPCYSMDNPVFEDVTSSVSTTAGSSGGAVPTSSVQTPHVHVRSDSCPSKLLGHGSDHRLLSPAGSQRSKHKDRPSAMNHFAARPVEAIVSDPPATSHHHAHSHRKSNSLDASSAASPPPAATDVKKPKQLMPPERFRCIVPYPPNSEYELELRVGDLVYVHKKRDDGWYKGTLQRTGRTGLFPGSFVESF